jgi:hypothetical protein
MSRPKVLSTLPSVIIVLEANGSLGDEKREKKEEKKKKLVLAY